MKFIIKDPEPQSFADWKRIGDEDWNPDWDDLQNPEKRDVHCALLREQGEICCYCGSPIIRSTSHIEHLRPRSDQRYPDLELDYSNLMASCNCGVRVGIEECDDPYADEDLMQWAARATESPQERAHCGHKKDHWYDEVLMVSPLMEDCESYFQHGEAGGKVSPVGDGNKREAAEITIERLGLNAARLIRLRKAALEPVLDELEPQEARDLIRGFSRKDRQGRFAPFAGTIISVLRRDFPV